MKKNVCGGGGGGGGREEGDKQAEYSILDQNNETNISRNIVATWNTKEQPPEKP